MSNLKGKRTRKTPTEEGYLTRIKELEIGYVKLCKELEQHKIAFKEVRKLCDLIVDSPPDTKIKGAIESAAFMLGHNPLILNCDSNRSEKRTGTPHRAQTEW